MFNFLRNCPRDFQGDVSSYAWPWYWRAWLVPHPLQHLVVLVFSFSHSYGWILVSHCGFKLQFLNGNDVEHFLMCLLTTCLSSFVKCLFKSFAGLLLYCYCRLLGVRGLYTYTTYKSFFIYLHCIYFLPFCGFPVDSLDGIFWWTDIFNGDRIQITFFLYVYAFLYFQISLPTSASWMCYSILCSNSF